MLLHYRFVTVALALLTLLVADVSGTRAKFDDLKTGSAIEDYKLLTFNGFSVYTPPSTASLKPQSGKNVALAISGSGSFHLADNIQQFFPVYDTYFGCVEIRAGKVTTTPASCRLRIAAYGDGNKLQGSNTYQYVANEPLKFASPYNGGADVFGAVYRFRVTPVDPTVQVALLLDSLQYLGS